MIEKASQSRIRHRVTGQWLGENEAETAQQKATCREREREGRAPAERRRGDRGDEDGETTRWIWGSGGGRGGRSVGGCSAHTAPLESVPDLKERKKKSPGQFE